MRAFQPIKDCMHFPGPMPLAFLDRGLAEDWKSKNDEEWISYNIKEVELRPLTYDEGAVGDQLVRIVRGVSVTGRKKVYVAHPFTTFGDATSNLQVQGLICKKLFSIGHIPVSPILTFGTVIPHDEDNYELAMAACFWLLGTCDEVWFFGEWRKSKGCLLEMDRAKALGKPVGFGFFCDICGADITYGKEQQPGKPWLCDVCGPS